MARIASLSQTTDKPFLTWRWLDEAERLAEIVDSRDIGKEGIQVDTGKFYKRNASGGWDETPGSGGSSFNGGTITHTLTIDTAGTDEPPWKLKPTTAPPDDGARAQIFVNSADGNRLSVKARDGKVVRLDTAYRGAYGIFFPGAGATSIGSNPSPAFYLGASNFRLLSRIRMRRDVYDSKIAGACNDALLDGDESGARGYALLHVFREGYGNDGLVIGRAKFTSTGYVELSTPSNDPVSLGGFNTSELNRVGDVLQLLVGGVVVDSAPLDPGDTLQTFGEDFGFSVGNRNLVGIMSSAQLLGAADAPIVQWMMLEGQGTALADTSGNGHHGTFGVGEFDEPLIQWVELDTVDSVVRGVYGPYSDPGVDYTLGPNFVTVNLPNVSIEAALDNSEITPIADGTRITGFGLTQNGTITTVKGIIVAQQEPA